MLSYRVRHSLIPLLACPDCRGDITLAQADPFHGSEIVNGILECSGCLRSFVIRYRIPHMLPVKLPAIQAQEMKARDEQVEEYDANLPLTLFGLAEIPLTMHYLDLHSNNRLLEAGCGTGRMTTKFARRVHEMVSVDFSTRSLRENEIKLQSAGLDNVHLIQADICHLPLKDALFDRVVSCQVIEHVPTAASRITAVAEISRAAKDEATVVISGYQYSKWTEDKEGLHEGGIPFTRFTQEEFIELLSTALTIEEITGTLIYLYLARTRKASSIPTAD